MVVPKINSSHGSETRNIINTAIDSINTQGKSIQDLVAKGQLTPGQYAELIQTVNGLISKGDVNVNDLSPELLKIINDSSGTPFEILSIPRDRSVTPKKTTFIKTSTNLLNERTLSINKIINSENGELIDGTRHTSDFIEVVPMQNVSFRYVDSYGRYDENLNFISKGAVYDTGVGDFRQMSSQTHYIRVEVYNSGLGQAQVNIGSELLPYERYYNVLTGADLPDGYVTESKTDFLERSSNIFDESSLIEKTSLNGSTGEEYESELYNSTPHIYVNAGEKYSIRMFDRILFYSADGTRHSMHEKSGMWQEGHTFTIPNGVASFRLMLQNQNVEKAQINKGEPVEYEPNYISIGGFKIGRNVLSSENGAPNDEPDNPELTEKNIVFAPEEVNSTFLNKDGEYTYPSISEIYTLYDDLINRFPDYLSKEVYGKDTTGKYDIWEIHAKPNEFDKRINGIGQLSTTPEQVNKLPKIIFNAGIHGHEQISVLGVYYMMKAICEDWKDDPILEYLRHNVEFKFIPVVYPDGYVTDVYSNVTGINLQTNFPYNFTPRDPDANVYGGEEPLTEIEVQYVKRLIDENTDALFYTDIHGFGGSQESKAMFYYIINSQDMYNKDLEWIAKYSIEKHTRNLKKSYPFNQNELLGFVQYREGNGTADIYAESVGVPGIVTEFRSRTIYDYIQHDSDSIKIASETLVNTFAIALKHYKDKQ